MKTLNPDYIDAVMTLCAQAPFLHHLSLTCLKLDLGYSLLKLDLGTQHHNPFGGIHGGVYASLIDTATYWALCCGIDPDVGLVTVDVSVNNLGAAQSGVIMVEGKQIKMGRSICLAEAKVTDERGKLLCHGTSKLMVVQGIQTMRQGAHLTGLGELPPQFSQNRIQEEQPA